MVGDRPYVDAAALFHHADHNWSRLEEHDLLEAFAGHPKIGDIESLQKKYSASKALAENEQLGVSIANESTLKKLLKDNRVYEEKFGFIFIICATGKSATQMLQLLRQRLKNNRDTELKNAAIEQHKIFRLRLEKLI